MPVFTYKAKDFKGKFTKGELNLDSEEAIKSYLIRKKLIPMEVKLKTIWNTDLKEFSIFRPKIKTQDIAIFCRQFAIMIESGISIGGTLHIIKEQIENISLKAIIQDIYEEVQKGKGLSEAMGEHIEFPSILLHIVEVGEISGNLDYSMNQMALYFEKKIRIQNQIKKAVTYPVIVMILMVVVIIGFLIIVIPQFIEMFEATEAELPTVTIAFLAISDCIKSKWYLIIGIIFSLIIGFQYVKRYNIVKYFVDWYLLNIPLLGNLNKKIFTANFSRTFSSLMKAGIPIIQIMEVIKKVLQNSVVMKDLDECIDEIKQGGSLGDSLSKRDLFPIMLVHMIRVGEESGSLDFIMNKTADFYEEEVEIAIEQMVTMISPIITIIMGVVVGFIMLAIVMPMFSLTAQI